MLGDGRGGTAREGRFSREPSQPGVKFLQASVSFPLPAQVSCCCLGWGWEDVPQEEQRRDWAGLLELRGGSLCLPMGRHVWLYMQSCFSTE